MAEASTVLPPDEQGAGRDGARRGRRADEQHRSSTRCSPSQPPAVQDEIIRINTEARPIALQVALLVPLLAGLIGLVNSFRMVRLPDVEPKADVEGYALG